MILPRTALATAVLAGHHPRIRHELPRVAEPAEVSHLSPAVCAIAWKGQHRLNSRYRRLMGRNMAKQRAIVAVARELLGFVWAIAQAVREAA